MQFINTKYHDPFIHEWIEFDEGFDLKKLAKVIEQLAEFSDCVSDSVKRKKKKLF